MSYLDDPFDVDEEIVEWDDDDNEFDEDGFWDEFDDADGKDMSEDSWRRTQWEEETWD